MDAGSGRKILIIEDETDVAGLLTLNLHKAGYGVSMAADGATALQKARDNRPDFIILDLMLPIRKRARAAVVTGSSKQSGIR